MPHGGQEGETGLVGEVCHIHNPLFIFLARIYCALSICAFVSFLFFSSLHTHTAQPILSDVVSGVDPLDFLCLVGLFTAYILDADVMSGS